MDADQRLAAALEIVRGLSPQQRKSLRALIAHLEATGQTHHTHLLQTDLSLDDTYFQTTAMAVNSSD